MHKKVLVVAAHPDDEVLGVGGTILRHTMMGDQVRILIMAEGVTSRDDVRDTQKHAAELHALHEKAQQVAKFLGAEKVELLSFPDNRMDEVDLLDVVKSIEQLVESFHPQVVYTHHAGDVNIDHQRTHEAVITACRSLPKASVQELYFFETLSSTEWQMPTAGKVFLPAMYVDISEVLEKKIAALKLYASEMRDYPHPRSYRAVKALAEYRGMTAGMHYAEAFAIGRVLWEANAMYFNSRHVCGGGAHMTIS